MHFGCLGTFFSVIYTLLTIPHASCIYPQELYCSIHGMITTKHVKTEGGEEQKKCKKKEKKEFWNFPAVLILLLFCSV